MKAASRSAQTASISSDAPFRSSRFTLLSEVNTKGIPPAAYTALTRREVNSASAPETSIQTLSPLFTPQE